MPEQSIPGRVLLAVCAAPDGDHSAAFAALSLDGWTALLDLAGEQRALPLLRRAVGRSQVANAAPDVAGTLREASVVQTQDVLRQRAALAAVLAVLVREGLNPIALKGVRLAWRDYPEPALRPLRDLDLLLRPADAERAQALLLASGDYAMFEGARPYGIEHGHQLPELYDRRHGVTLELHHRLNARGWTEEAGLLAKMHAERETLGLGDGLVATVPSSAANFLHLVEHATLHHLFDNGPLVLADLHYASHGLELAEVAAEAKRLGLTRALALVSAIALRFGAAWPARLPIEPDSDAERVEAGMAALLRPDEVRRDIALFRRLEQRTGAGPGLAAAMHAALRPDPSALAGIAGTEPRNPLRWLAYPIWLQRRMRAYGRAGEPAVRAEAADQVALHRWLHGR